MKKPIFFADKTAYRTAGFVLLETDDGSVKIVPTVLPSKESTIPEIGIPFDPKESLFFQCALTIGVWGPLGNFTIEPSENGLVFHQPHIHAESNPITMTLHPQGRTLRSFGGWVIDIVYWLDQASTALVQHYLTEVFKEISRRGVLVIERKIRHKIPAYHSPYKVTFEEDGSVTISLKHGVIRRLLSFLKKWKWIVPQEVSVTLGKLEWTGIEIKSKK